MNSTREDSTTLSAGTMERPGSSRWLLFVHQIPSRASGIRVRTWRRLQQMGAIAVKQAVYVLPNTPEHRERFEWLKTELDASGGDVTIFVADNVDKWSADALAAAFRAARRADYDALRADMAPVAARLARRGPRRHATDVTQQLSKWRERFAAIERIDYFGATGRDEVRAVLANVEQVLTATATQSPSRALESRAAYQGRVWVTRPRPGVDRMASAWLIRTRIDPRATFSFAADRAAVPDSAVAFDMYGVRFTHEGGGCTFETLCRAFAIHEPAVTRIAALVHALDLDDGTPMPPDGPTVERLIEGLQLAHGDDHALLEHGVALFEALHRTFEHQEPKKPIRAARRTMSAGRHTRRARGAT